MSRSHNSHKPLWKSQAESIKPQPLNVLFKLPHKPISIHSFRCAASMDIHFMIDLNEPLSSCMYELLLLGRRGVLVRSIGGSVCKCSRQSSF
jgi:hypothetical protein